MLDTLCAAPVPLNLGEPCNPWFYCVAIEKIIKCGVPVGTLIYRIGPRADQAHLPFEYIDICGSSSKFNSLSSLPNGKIRSSPSTVISGRPFIFFAEVCRMVLNL